MAGTTSTLCGLPFNVNRLLPWSPSFRWIMSEIPCPFPKVIKTGLLDGLRVQHCTSCCITPAAGVAHRSRSHRPHRVLDRLAVVGTFRRNRLHRDLRLLPGAAVGAPPGARLLRARVLSETRAPHPAALLLRSRADVVVDPHLRRREDRDALGPDPALDSAGTPMGRTAHPRCLSDHQSRLLVHRGGVQDLSALPFVGVGMAALRCHRRHRDLYAGRVFARVAGSRYPRA